MIELESVEFQRGGKPLLENASLRVHHGDKLALIGANGSGKSSLFRLLLGLQQADAGELRQPSDWRLAHMAQEVSASDRSAKDFVLDGHRSFRQAEQALAKAEAQDDSNAAAKHIATLDSLQAWQLPSEAERLLAGLGFKDSDFQRPVKDFSGGWRIRLNLAQALMCPSDLLLLDEPTNHLDMDACLWLERWLQAYTGTLLLISHDRDFIDACCQGVVHLHQRQLQRYNGNYSAFERQRGERLAQQQQAYEKQQVEIAHMEQFIRRFKAKASKAKQAQSRVKALARMSEISAAHVDSPFRFQFAEPGRMPDPLLSLRAADLGYQDAVLTSVSLGIHPGSRIALLGANGQGKSTLIKSLAGEISLLGGDRVESEHLRIGYFGQHQLEALDLDASPVSQLQRLRPEAREQEIRDYLGGFNFRGEQVDGDIHHFSGGEKARLALALIAWQRPNLLLLDEPTNHLDLDMCHALTAALQGYEGALVLISHDRHLLRNTADQLFLLKNGKIEEFNGDLDDYRQLLLNKDIPIEQPDSAKNDNKKAQRQAAAAARAKRAPLSKTIKTLERDMDAQNSALAELEQALADPAIYEAEQKQALQELLGKQAELRQQSAATEEAWLEAQEALEALED